MIKINISSKTIENFKTQVLSNFYNDKKQKIVFKKEEDNKLKWSIDIGAINRLIKRKLKNRESMTGSLFFYIKSRCQNIKYMLY